MSNLKVALVAPIVGTEEIDAVVEVLRSGQLAQGPVVAAFEAEVAQMLGVRHAIAVNSGTAAIHCGLQGLGISDGDEVLTTPFTFAATASPILMQRGKVRFVDIDPRTFNVDLEKYEAAVSSSTKAVVGVDLFGLPFDRTGIAALGKRGIAVLDDACQAIGARRNGTAVGSDCDAAAFSFYATKNLMMGEGGVLTTNSDDVAASARSFRQHGQGDRYEYLELGYNYRLTDVLAAFGRVQLGRATHVTQGRQANARFYDGALSEVPGVSIPLVPPGVEHAYHQYTILIDPAQTPRGVDRDAVRQELSQAGVASGIYYPKPLHLHPLFGGPRRQGEFPNAERASKHVLSLPIHSGLSQDQLSYVVEAIRTAVGS